MFSPCVRIRVNSWPFVVRPLLVLVTGLDCLVVRPLLVLVTGLYCLVVRPLLVLVTGLDCLVVRPLLVLAVSERGDVPSARTLRLRLCLHQGLRGQRVSDPEWYHY